MGEQCCKGFIYNRSTGEYTFGSQELTFIRKSALCMYKEVHYNLVSVLYTVMILSFGTDMSKQTVQTQIRLLLEEQSDQGLHCLLFNLHHRDKITLKLSF